MSCNQSLSGAQVFSPGRAFFSGSASIRVRCRQPLGAFDTLVVNTSCHVVVVSAALALFAAVAGTALLCDAWFDLLTASPGSDLRWSLVEAFVAELPLAALCFWMALDSDRALASAARASGAGLPPTVRPGRPAEGTERART